MTMKLPQKAGFVATPDEWDALVRIAENLAAQVVQRDAALREMQAERDAALRDLIHVAEQWHASEKALDAARAEVARLTALVEKLQAERFDSLADNVAELDQQERAALRGQPAPAQDDDARDAMIEILEDEPAPAQGQE